MQVQPSGVRQVIPSIHVSSVSGPTKPEEKRGVSFTSSPQYVDEIITMSSFVRRWIWCTILFLVIFNAALLVVFAVMYMQNERHGSLLWLFRIYFLFSEGNAFLMNYSTRVALGYALLSVIFGLVAVRMVWKSASHHRLRFGSVHVSRSISSARTGSVLARSASAFQSIKSWFKKCHRAIGVRGAYFDLRLLAEEIFEIGTQTAAALSASQSISNVPLNIIYAVVIFLNSIASFVFRRVFRKSLVKQRIACLLTDLVLDFVWGTLLPMWMYLPIVKIWLDRDNVLSYIESFANSTREVERVLVISWELYVLSVIPFCNSLLNLLELQNILREIAPKRSSSQLGPPNGDPQTYLQLQYPVGRIRTGFFMRLAHAILPIYGIAALIMTLTANEIFRSIPESNQFGCLHRVYPWFSTKEACLGRQINCTTLGIQSNAVEIEQALELFDKTSLADLFVLSCPGFEMPSEIQSFSRLMTIVIKDSTIVEWSEGAMLRGQHFHELRTIQLKDVVLLQDPIGLIGVVPISSSVEWIHLEGVDGTRILNLVDDHWKGLLYFDCMACGLTTIPEALYHMPKLTMVSLAFNDIAVVPDDWIPRSQLQLQTVWFDINLQLASLPDSLWQQAATCGIFSMSWTNLSVIPEWVADIAGPDFQLTAIDTAICTGLSSLPTKVQRLVLCS